MNGKHLKYATCWLGLLVGLFVAVAARATPQSQPQNHTQSDTKKTATPQRIVLRPKLAPGEVMHYQIEFQTTSETTRSGIVQDSQNPSQLVVTWDGLVRLEVLGGASETDTTGTQGVTKGTVSRAAGRASSSTKPKPTGAAGMRLRTTYEKSSATVKSDAPDPEEENIKSQYAHLEGLSIEFTLGSDGRVSDVRGLEGITPNEQTLKAAQQLITQLSGGASLPAAGIVPGQKWTSQQAADSLPLAGMAWRTDSTYLRNEPCRPVSPAGNAPVTDVESCAVILTQLALVSPRSTGDPTPEEFRRNGLHTSGHWTGSGQNLSYISLQSGWMVSVTQDGTEQMDVTISNPRESNNIHYAGTVGTRSQVSLVPAETALPK